MSKKDVRKKLDLPFEPTDGTDEVQVMIIDISFQDPDSTHKGETREERILQYQEIPDVPPVLALREGSILHVEGQKANLKGQFQARLFVRGQEPKEYPCNTDFSFLL